MTTTNVNVTIYPEVPPAANPDMPPASAPPPQASYPPPQASYPPPQASYPPPQASYPPPQASHPPPQASYPPPQASYPPPQASYPPPQASYPPPQQLPPQQQMPPQQQYPPPTYSGPAHPQATPVAQPGMYTGMSVRDAFRQDNEIQLVAKANGKPIRVHNCKFMGNGNYADECNFRVVVTGDTTVMLQHVFFKGQWVAIHDAKIDPLSCKGKGKDYSQLRLHIMPDNYVMLESAKYPGRYVNMTANGLPKAPEIVRADDQDGQFYVRVVKQIHPTSQTVFNSMGRPSILNSLRDQMLVQLTSSRGAQLIRIKGGGKVDSTPMHSEKDTLLMLRDRGMGILSFHCHASPGYWLRMIGGKMVGKGGETELSGDFRLLENPDGSVSFELVKVPGSFITANGEKDFTIYQVTLTGSSAKKAINRAPIMPK